MNILPGVNGTACRMNNAYIEKKMVFYKYWRKSRPPHAKANAWQFNEFFVLLDNTSQAMLALRCRNDYMVRCIQC